jgi:hypothetical protein
MSLPHRFVTTLAAVLTLALVLSVQGAHARLTQDLVISDLDGPDQVCLRDKGGHFLCTELSPESSGSNGLAVGDVDGDGNADVVFAAGFARANRVCLGDGAGSFACSAIEDEQMTSVGVALADFDRNGTLDAVFANVMGRPNRVCLGDGHGGFGCSWLGIEIRASNGVAIADVNGDRVPDLLFANDASPNDVCLGDGTGLFSCSPMTAYAAESFAVAAGDLNGDGKVDAVFANLEPIPGSNPPRHNSACLGDGTGRFTCNAITTDLWRAVGVALGDVNHDGKLDAVFSNTNQSPQQLCLGDGTGKLACERLGGDVSASSAVALIDLNGDGHLDAVFANCSVEHGQVNRACFGDGTGEFRCEDVSDDVMAGRAVGVTKLTPF